MPACVSEQGQGPLQQLCCKHVLSLATCSMSTHQRLIMGCPCLIVLGCVVCAAPVHLSADTLHRFCKKEHDWGWKKFMELSKVLEGFTVANTLVIKAQVQVIR